MQLFQLHSVFDYSCQYLIRQIVTDRFRTGRVMYDVFQATVKRFKNLFKILLFFLGHDSLFFDINPDKSIETHIKIGNPND